MNPFFSGIAIIGGPLPVVVDALALAALAVLLLRPRRSKSSWPRWAATAAASLGIGALVGLAACWIVGDLANVFDITLTPLSRGWVAAAGALVALAALGLWFGPALRRICAGVAVILALVAAALGVNADFGQYTTLGSIADAAAFSPIPAGILAAQRAAIGGDTSTTLLSHYSPPVSGLPSQGLVGSVQIPATQSHFRAREAIVYLPPAALGANPPALPVFVMMSGQPGSPQNVVLAGHIDAIMDSIAAANHGVAPIVVVPDQLGAPDVNPMCVDSVLGNAATYLTVDVPAWITTHLHVATSPASWTIGGYSEGGTCSIQFGAAHPEIFGSIVDVSGELEPRNGDLAHTVKVGFDGDADAYDLAKPLTVLRQRAPYTDTLAVFGVGEFDSEYTEGAKVLSNAARTAGMASSLVIAPGSGHDWTTVRYVLTEAMPALLARMGITTS